MAIDPITAGTLAAGATSAGVAAAIPLAARGVAAALPSARRKRKLDKKLLDNAVNRVERGEKYGFGPSRRRRNQMVADRMRQYDEGAKGQTEALQRQQALQGFGRSGYAAQQQREMAEQRASAQAQTRSAVEDEARSIARYNERAARQDLSQQRGVEAQNVADRRAFATEVATGAALQGIAAGKAAKDELTSATYGKGAAGVAADVAKGASPAQSQRRSMVRAGVASGLGSLVPDRSGRVDLSKMSKEDLKRALAQIEAGN